MARAEDLQVALERYYLPKLIEEGYAFGPPKGAMETYTTRPWNTEVEGQLKGTGGQSLGPRGPKTLRMNSEGGSGWLLNRGP